jgi:hypothetical protein
MNLITQNLQRMLDNRLLRIVRPKREETREGLRKLHNMELHTGYFSPDVSRIIRAPP